MTDMVRFSDPARLYAEHAAIVELMEREFLQSISNFLDSIVAALRPMVNPETLREKQTGKQGTRSFRYWWLADTPDDMEAHPLLWFETGLSAIVDPGRLAMTVCTPRATKDERVRYMAVSKEPALAPYSKSASGGTWSLFTFTVTYADGDPIEQVAEPISRLLLALRQTERSILNDS